MQEVHENCPGVKLVLTALKCDLRRDDEQNDNPDAIAFDQGLAKAKEIGAVKYLGMLTFDILVSMCFYHLYAFYWHWMTQLSRMLCRAKSRDSRNLLWSGEGGFGSQTSRLKFHRHMRHFMIVGPGFSRLAYYPLIVSSSHDERTYACPIIYSSVVLSLYRLHLSCSSINIRKGFGVWCCSLISRSSSLFNFLISFFFFFGFYIFLPTFFA